jgi:hypothetical protein
MPGDPARPNAAAGAIALAAASALDLTADLSRRSKILIAVAPKLRSKPAAKIVDLMLSQDCVSPAEAARQAPMTDRAARRLFDRLVALGAVRELTGRPTFRAVRPMTTAARRRQRGGHENLDVELADLPRAGANGCSGSKPPSSPRKNPSRARRSSGWSAKPAGSTI